MPTPIKYYGGKSLMLKHILPLIPPHKCYCEPFCGGAAVAFSKIKCGNDNINDFNGFLTNFYEVAKDKIKRKELWNLVRKSLHSQATHKYCLSVYRENVQVGDVERAFAFWYLTNFSFGNIVGSGFAYRKTSEGGSMPEYMQKHISEFKHNCNTLRYMTIWNEDGLTNLKRLDTVDTFSYIDTPYVDTEHKYIGGYNSDNQKELLDYLQNECKGKFLFSCYPSEAILSYAKANNWHIKTVEKNFPLNGQGVTKMMKTEMLMYNYELKKENTLF